jgi:hypothetical protein
LHIVDDEPDVVVTIKAVLDEINQKESKTKK